MENAKSLLNFFFIDIDTEDEIIKAREQSAKFRAKIRKLKTELGVEKHNRDMKTLKELEKLKSLQGKGKEAKEEETTPDGLQKTETREGGYQRRLREMPRRTCFVQLLPHCRPRTQKRIFVYDLEKKSLIYKHMYLFPRHGSEEGMDVT